LLLLLLHPLLTLSLRLLLAGSRLAASLMRLLHVRPTYISLLGRLLGLLRLVLELVVFLYLFCFLA
jgi:hypothetical protein